MTETSVRRKVRFACMAVIAAAGLLGAQGCQRGQNASPAASAKSVKHYLLRGRVMQVDMTGKTVTVSHGAIPGFMDAMTMPYKVKDANVLTELHPGDQITATLVDVDEAQFYLDNIVVTAQANPDYKPTSEYHAPAAGEEVPDFTLVNQSGKTIRIRQFRGKVLLITFIYTRCPMSDYCPRMSRNFAQIDKLMHADKSTYDRSHLLSISFDPAYDVPAVLRSYGGAYTGNYTKEKFEHWDFAAPSSKDLVAMEQWFNVGVTPGDTPTQMNHSLSTLLIGADGRVIEWYPTNEWSPDDVAQAMKHAMVS